jgi:hypothetical protein
MTMNSGSASNSVFEFNSIDATVTDIRFEIRKGIDGVYGDWTSLPLTTTESDVTYLGFSHVYKYTASTPDWNGGNGYQFKVMMASSDNTITPEVITLDVHSQSTNDYSDAGFWKTTIDLGTNLVSIDSLTYTTTEPTDTYVNIRTRTSTTDGNWGPWSVPYSADTARAVLNSKANTSIKDGFIITPTISPENITNWQSFKLKHFLNYIDTFSGASTPGSTITVDIVKADYHPNPQTLEENQANTERVLATFVYTNDTQVDKIISSITEHSIRFKISLHKETGTATPAIDHLYTISNAYYVQYKTFGTGDADLKGYGSAVYGQNTGIDKVYTNGISRSSLASISNLGFTIPSGAEGPQYVIEINNLFSQTYTAEELDIYWNSNSLKTVVFTDTLTDDYLIVRAKPGSTGAITKHYRYGSGLATTITPSYLSSNITNTFSPSLKNGTAYAYFIQNGFVLGSPNTNLDIRWASENTLTSSDRRNISYTLNDTVYISIVSSQSNGLTEWVSEEKKFEAIVNANDMLSPYVTTLIYDDDPSVSQIPEISPGVVVNSDPSIIPYKVEVIDGSVVCNGVRRSNDVITTNVRYIYSVLGTPSLVEHVEEKIEVKRTAGTNIDQLPKAMIKKLNGTVDNVVLGVYSDPDLYAPDYANKINPDTGVELETGHYKYYTATGTYSNTINWAPAIAAGTAPADGTSYYVSYVYDKVVSLRIELSCNYSEYEPVLQVYRSPTIARSGECSLMTDYVSSEFSFNDFTIPSDVDKSTLRYVVYDNNKRVRTYVDNNKVVGTLDNRDPKISWTPSVQGGYYYINKDSYYMYMDPSEYTLDKSTIPIAKNVSYAAGYNGTGILVEESTANIAPTFNGLSSRTAVFSSSFNEPNLIAPPLTWDEFDSLPLEVQEQYSWNGIGGTN